MARWARDWAARVVLLPFFACSAEVPLPIEVLGSSNADLGAARVGETLSHQFRVRNVSGSDLHLKRLDQSCNCTSSSLDPPLLADDEVGTLSVEVEVRSPGRLRAELMLVFEGQSEVAFSLAAEGEAEILVHPAQVTALRVLPGSRQPFAARLRSAQADLEIVSGDTPAELEFFLSVEPEPVDDQGNLLWTTYLGVAAGARLPPGLYTGEVRVRSRGGQEPPAAVPYTVVVPPEESPLGGGLVLRKSSQGWRSRPVRAGAGEVRVSRPFWTEATPEGLVVCAAEGARNTRVVTVTERSLARTRSYSVPVAWQPVVEP